MIDYDEVMQKIEETKKRFTSVRDRIPKVEEKIFDLTKRWTDAVIDNASDEKLGEIRDELQKAEKELDLLEHLDIEKEIRESLSKDKKLKTTTEQFIKQQEEVIEEMLVEDNKLYDDLKAACDTLLEAIRNRRKHSQKMAGICSEIDSVKRALGQKAPDSGTFWSLRERRGQINIENLYTKIRGAAGLPLIP